MLKGLIAGFSLAVGLLAVTPAQAMRMEYDIEWRCTSAYVTVDGWTYPAGVYCTSFIIQSSFYEPAGNDLQYWDNLLAGGAFRYRVGRGIPDAVDNNQPATCESDEIDRWLHAMNDVREYNLLRVLTMHAPLPAGTLVRITYDDGGSEVWTAGDAGSSAPLIAAPKGGSLRCPNP